MTTNVMRKMIPTKPSNTDINSMIVFFAWKVTSVSFREYILRFQNIDQNKEPIT